VLGKKSKWKNPAAWAAAQEAKQLEEKNPEKKKKQEKGSAHVSTLGAFLQLLIELKAAPPQQVANFCLCVP